jgi:hypothetical protein
LEPLSRLLRTRPVRPEIVPRRMTNHSHIRIGVGCALLLWAAFLAVRANRTSEPQRDHGTSGGNATSADRGRDLEARAQGQAPAAKRLERQRSTKAIRLGVFWDALGGPENPDGKLINADYLSRLDFPDPRTLGPAELREFLRIIALIGDCVHIEASTRFAFIRDNVPAPWLETTADDMLRFLSIDELQSVVELIDQLPAGEPKCDMYRLAAQRMVRLERPRHEIEVWIASLANQDERDAARLMLSPGP